jgi:hypothetical protein
MNGFVATAPTGSTVPGDTDAIGNDGWFPDLSMSILRDTLRLDGTVTDIRLRESSRYAIAYVNNDLADFAAGHQDNGTAALADVSSATIDGESRLTMLYRRAVSCMVKADLIERYRDYDSTDSAQRRALEMDPGVDEQRRNARWAVRDILGKPHAVVELI